MANVTKRTGKDGTTSYLIRAYAGETSTGKQIVKSTTWKPPAGMRPAAADRQAEKEAVLFEQRVRSGVASIDGKTKFADYAARWMENAELAPKTREQYEYLLVRINAAIGNIALEKLRADHVQAFLKNLREEGVKTSGEYARSDCFEALRVEMKLTQRKLCELSGVSVSTIIAASRGKHVSIDTARKLCAAMDKPLEPIFMTVKGSDKLSDRTVWHHYKVIRAILAAAKKARIIPHNVAGEFMDAPKLPRTEARYLSDDEAKRFLSALLTEPDIRIRTALTLDLFTGLRRGELCGLAWSDIDFEGHAVHVRRASQYVAGQGVIEVPTKNKSSERSLSVTAFVMGLLQEYRLWWLEQRFHLGDAWQGEKQRLFIQADGKPLFPDTINFWLKGFLERNQFPPITVHSLRHTFATLQLAAGVDIRTLQARTGHAQASTLLNVYSHAIQSAQERAAKAMDDILLPATIRAIERKA